MRPAGHLLHAHDPEATPVVYDADEEFPIGGSKTLRGGDGGVATIVGAGVTVRESLAAADALAAEGIAVRVIDAYSVKPIDAATLRQALDETGAIVVAEDHRVEGGSATPCSKRWPRPARSLARWSSSASATCRAREHRRRCGPWAGIGDLDRGRRARRARLIRTNARRAVRPGRRS